MKKRLLKSILSGFMILGLCLGVAFTPGKAQAGYRLNKIAFLTASPSLGIPFDHFFAANGPKY